jgi:protein-tyrosine-phosphatase
MVAIRRIFGRSAKKIYRFMVNTYDRANLKTRKTYRNLPTTIRSVLFVCKGNICRSPLAAAYFESRLPKQGRRIEVRSAGLDTTPGKTAHPFALDLAQQNDLRLHTHLTASLTPELVDTTDLILVMDLDQRSMLVEKYPGAEGKVFQLGYFNDSLSTEIADPFGGTKSEFEICYKAIRRSCDNLLGYLKDRQI